jgi:hypothetical protein
MTESDLLNIGLIKWPALVVKGEPVTKDQAKEILIRTDSLYLSCNDREWEEFIQTKFYDIDPSTSMGNGRRRYDQIDEELREKHGISEKDHTRLWEIKGEYEDSVGSIEGLEYLQNSRIASSWIGGAHGWCNWDGTIGTSEYNIGKYPSVSEVYEEWKIIAREFPFLDLRCQIMNEESCGDDEDNTTIKPVVEFVVKAGKVKLIEPVETITIPIFGWKGERSERGCTEEIFSDALNYAKNKVKIEKMLSSDDAWVGVSK